MWLDSKLGLKFLSRPIRCIRQAFGPLHHLDLSCVNLLGLLGRPRVHDLRETPNRFKNMGSKGKCKENKVLTFILTPFILYQENDSWDAKDLAVEHFPSSL